MVFYLFVIFVESMLAGSLLGIGTQAEPLIGEHVKRAAIGKFPYVVSIVEIDNQFDEKKTHICTGVLITRKFVLTAAHCFDERLLRRIRIIVGSVDLRHGQKHDITMWITYNQWAKSKNITAINGLNDITIVKLLHKVNRRIGKLASLSFIEKNYGLHDESVVLVGWGVTNQSTEQPQQYLHEAKVNLLSNAVCEKFLYAIFQRKFIISDKYLCTQGVPQVFLGGGDSGGPVLRGNSVVAVNLGTCPKAAQCGLPEEVLKYHKFNVHISIDFYKEFIDNAVKNY